MSTTLSSATFSDSLPAKFLGVVIQSEQLGIVLGVDHQSTSRLYSTCRLYLSGSVVS